MNGARVIRVAGHLFLGAAILALLAGIVPVNWQLASSRGSHRLRWFFEAKADLPKGSRLTVEHVTRRLGWLQPGDAGYVYRVSDVTGKYALRSFSSDNRLVPGYLGPSPDLKPPPGGVIIPIAVKSEYAAALRLGMRVAFAKTSTMIPDWKEIGRKGGPGGFEVMALVPSADKPASTVVIVELRSCQTRHVSALAASDLVPVILPPLR